jgi:hypothetical protein
MIIDRLELEAAKSNKSRAASAIEAPHRRVVVSSPERINIIEEDFYGKVYLFILKRSQSSQVHNSGFSWVGLAEIDIIELNLSPSNCESK